MSAQKYSYKPTNTAAASTVILLKDRAALEVRRGTKTRWAPGETRVRWPSLAAWKESLPADAQITKSAATSSSGSGESVPLSPEMARVVTGLTSVGQNGKKYPLCGNLFTYNPAERIRTQIAAYSRDLQQYGAARPHFAMIYDHQINALTAMLATTNDAQVYSIPRNSNSSVRLYCKAADGSLQRVWFNHRLGVFGVRDGTGVRAAATLVELGFPADAELYGRRRYEDDLIKL